MKILGGSFDVAQIFRMPVGQLFSLLEIKGALNSSLSSASGWFGLCFLRPGRSKSPTGGRLPGWTRGCLWATVVFCFPTFVFLLSNRWEWNLWTWCWQFKKHRTPCLSLTSSMSMLCTARDPQTAPWLKVRWINAHMPQSWKNLERDLQAIGTLQSEAIDGSDYCSFSSFLSHQIWSFFKQAVAAVWAHQARSVSSVHFARPKVNRMRQGSVAFECFKHIWLNAVR